MAQPVRWQKSSNSQFGIFDLSRPANYSCRSCCTASVHFETGGQRMRSLADEFKTFIFRGNLIELAVAIVIGVAFTDLVKALVDDIFTPLIAAVFGEPDFSQLTFTINGSVFKYGDLINKIFAFLSVAL